MLPVRRELLQQLARQIDAIQADHRPHGRSTLALPLIDLMLPGQQLPAGSLVEILADPGSGARSLALQLAWQACGPGKALIVIDPEECFYPPAAVRLGVDLRRTVIVRPRSPRDTFLAVHESLRSPAVGGVIAEFPRLTTRDARRLQLAAEAGGGLGILRRPLGALRQPAFAILRLQLTSIASPERMRRSRVDVVRGPNHAAGRVLHLEIGDDAILVHPPSRLASATTRARSAHASG